MKDDDSTTRGDARRRQPDRERPSADGRVDAIADMAQRVQLNGPEPTYASEKLAYALYKAAEGLALCDVELEEVISEVHRGYRARCLC